MEKENRGPETEDYVETICRRMFLSDFTVRNPKYRKPNRQLKEAADFLVPFGSHLLAFQVRSKTETKSATEKAPKDFDRIARKVDAAIDQFKAVEEALDEDNILELRNGRGILLPFDRATLKTICGIVILDLIGEDQFPADDRTEIWAGYEVRRGIPIHVFRREVFEEISGELDTVPDFVGYLAARAALFERDVLLPTTSELDFLSVYKMRPDLIRACLAGECDLLVIEDGYWQTYREGEVDRIRNRDMLNEPSRIVDDYLNRAHEAIGFEIDYGIADGRNDARQGTVTNYWAAALEFASLNRLCRRFVGTRLLEKMRKADKVGHGYGAALLPDGTAVIVLALNASREERMNALFDLSATLYCGMGLTKLLGIATDPLSAQMRSYDALCLKGVVFENHDELATQFRERFKQPQRESFTEYGGRKPSLPR